MAGGYRSAGWASRDKVTVLRGQAVELPGGAFTGIAEAVVEAVGAALPEFDSIGSQKIAAPEGGKGDVLAVEAGFDFMESGLYGGTVGDDGALIGGPGG